MLRLLLGVYLSEPSTELVLELLRERLAEDDDADDLTEVLRFNCCEFELLSTYEIVLSSRCSLFYGFDPWRRTLGLLVINNES